MKYKSAFKKDVKEICKQLRVQFFVGEYEMSFRYHSEDDEKDGNKTAASIPIDFKYLNFSINIYPILQKIWEENKDDFFTTLVHEFSHLLTEPLYIVALKGVSEREQDFLEEIRERQTQRICNIVSPFLKKLIFKKAPKAKRKKKK